MADDADFYQTYYAGKLWSLLPEIYRTLDSTSAFDPSVQNPPNGPLRELVNRIGKQAATLRRSIDRMWEDQSIEGCDDWVIPYIGAQLAANLVSSLDARAQRLDVFKTIYYRQRKGTLPILEEIAADITGWDARVVELYRRMGRARHGLDPPFGRPVGVATPAAHATAGPSPPVAAGLVGANTRTPAGGYADLRNDYGASRAGTAFDELSYTADLRLGQGQTGWYNITNLGVFLWRLQSVLVQGVTPVAVSDQANQYTFDPTGRDVPLFAFPVQAFDTNWIPRQEYQLPGPIDDRLLKVALSKLYATVDPTNRSLQGNAIGLYKGVPSVATLVPLHHISADPHETTHYVIDAVRGRVTAPAGSHAHPMPLATPHTTASPHPRHLPAPPLQVSYCYGFSSTIGAGGYDRRVRGQPQLSVPCGTSFVTGGGSNFAAISSETVEISDSLTYNSAPNTTIGSATGPNSLVVRASNLARPLVRFPHSATGPAQWTFTGSTVSDPGNTLVLDGLFVSGGDIVVEGNFDAVTISTCTLDPGAWNGDAARLAADRQPLIPAHLCINGTVRSLVIDRCILGPVTTNGTGSVERVTITNSILQAVAPIGTNAIEIETGITTIGGCTVLGNARFHQLEATDSLFCGVVTVANNQQGCVRFSAWTSGSVLPSQYACVQLDPGQELFASTAFGDPHFAQLLPSVDPGVGAGAEDASEMGAFSRDKNPIKECSLLLKYQEYMPIGLTPVLIYVT